MAQLLLGPTGASAVGAVGPVRPVSPRAWPNWPAVAAMGNGRSFRRQLDFSSLAGQKIPGGCDCCDAYQTLEEVAPGIHTLTVHHDDDCPFLRARQAEAN